MRLFQKWLFSTGRIAPIVSRSYPFEAARPQIAERLSQQKIAAELRKYIQRLRAQAIIEFKNDEIRKAWEVGISAEPTY